jgi:acyl-CoA thioester hydrolase
MAIHTCPLASCAADIDMMGHVNNVVYVRWLQDLGTAHWNAVATAAEQAAMIWLVTRHEVDYLRPTLPGEEIEGRT